MLKFAIGIGIPYTAIILLMPWANSVHTLTYGIPFIYIWMFLWFVLTSACLLACWLLFDRHAIDPDLASQPTKQGSLHG